MKLLKRIVTTMMKMKAMRKLTTLVKEYNSQMKRRRKMIMTVKVRKRMMKMKVWLKNAQNWKEEWEPLI